MRSTATCFVLVCLAGSLGLVVGVVGCASGGDNADETEGDSGTLDRETASEETAAHDDTGAADDAIVVPPAPDAPPADDAMEFDAAAASDAGSSDAAKSDSGKTDSGKTDAGAPDTGATDTAPPDAGSSPCGPIFVTITGQKKITAGGTYENLIVTSPNSDTAAIEIATSAPVILRCIRGSGPGDFVHGGSDVTIDRSKYVGTTATRDNTPPGKFYQSYGPKNVVIERSYMEHTSGILVQAFGGDGSASQTVRVRFNDAKNIDGRYRNGGSEFQNFVGVQDGNRSSAEIAYNRVVTEPGKGRAEDNISMYKNGGTAARPFKVYKNYIEGSYPDDFLKSATTGTSINCDGDSSTTDANMPQYGLWTNNFVTGGAAINMAVGRQVTADDNTIVSVGRTRSGIRYRSGYAGMSLFNYLGTPMWGPNRGARNRILWLRDDSAVTSSSPYSSTRADIDKGAAFLTDTDHMTLPFATAEQWAYDEFMKMLTTDGVTVGPGW